MDGSKTLKKESNKGNKVTDEITNLFFAKFVYSKFQISSRQR